MSVKFDQQFNASADQLWAIVGTPDRIDWVPGEIKERILSRDPEQRTMEYSCFETPAPLESHHASMQVIANSDGCRFIWETAITPVAFESFIRTSMEGCLEQIGELLELNS